MTKKFIFISLTSVIMFQPQEKNLKTYAEYITPDVLNKVIGETERIVNLSVDFPIDAMQDALDVPLRLE